MQVDDRIRHMYRDANHIIKSIQEPNATQMLTTMCGRRFFVADCQVVEVGASKTCKRCAYYVRKQKEKDIAKEQT